MFLPPKVIGEAGPPIVSKLQCSVIPWDFLLTTEMQHGVM